MCFQCLQQGGKACNLTAGGLKIIIWPESTDTTRPKRRTNEMRGLALQSFRSPASQRPPCGLFHSGCYSAPSVSPGKRLRSSHCRIPYTLRSHKHGPFHHPHKNAAHRKNIYTPSTKPKYAYVLRPPGCRRRPGPRCRCAKSCPGHLRSAPPHWRRAPRGSRQGDRDPEAECGREGMLPPQRP